MPTILYETHRIRNPQLPFIYHPAFKRTLPESAANWHENIELLYCLEGSGHIRCGTRVIPFSPGELVVINADTLHSFGTPQTLVYSCLIIDNSFFFANGVPVDTLYFQERVQSARIPDLFQRVSRAYDRLDPGDYLTTLQIRTCVLELILALCEDCTDFRPAAKQNNNVKKVITYLRQNYHKPICLDELSRCAGISKYHLTRQFRLHTGSTVVKTLNAIRCAQALRLISDGMLISQAARLCGFENLSYFTRVFSRLYQHPPSHYLPQK